MSYNQKTFIHRHMRYRIVFTTDTQGKAEKVSAGMYRGEKAVIKQLSTGRWAIGFRDYKKDRMRR